LVARIVSYGTFPSASAINWAGMLTTRASRWPELMSCISSSSSEILRAMASQRARWLAGANRPAVSSKGVGM
jgi:hypothetical protein